MIILVDNGKKKSSIIYAQYSDIHTNHPVLFNVVSESLIDNVANFREILLFLGKLLVLNPLRDKAFFLLFDYVEENAKIKFFFLK